MIEPFVITTANIDALIQSIKTEMKKTAPEVDTEPRYFGFPNSIRGELNRDKYKGRGRPRNDDYRRIPFPDYLPIEWN